MLRRHIGIIVCLFAAAVSAPVAGAAPITYKFNFTVQFGVGPTGGAFTYDAAISTFTNFTVTWDGVVWDLTASANNPDISSPPPPCLGGLTGAAAAFFQLDAGPGGDPGAPHGCFHSGPGPSNSWFGNPQFGQPGFERFRFLTQGTNGDTSFIEVHATQADASGAQSGGQWSVTATPEPSTPISLFTALIVLAFAPRIHRARGRQATQLN